MTRVVDTPQGIFTFSGVLPAKTKVGIFPIAESDFPPPGPPDQQVSCSTEHLSSANSTFSVLTSVAPLGENFSRPSSVRQAAKATKANLSLCLKKTTKTKKTVSAPKLTEALDAPGPAMVVTEDVDFAYDEGVNVLQDTISRLHNRLEAADLNLAKCSVCCQPFRTEMPRTLAWSSYYFAGMP